MYVYIYVRVCVCVWLSASPFLSGWWSLTKLQREAWLNVNHELQSLRTRHTLEPLAWHWSHWPDRLVNQGGECLFSQSS